MLGRMVVTPGWRYLGMDQYLLIPFLGGWTSIYQLFWGSPGTRALTHPHFFLDFWNDAPKWQVSWRNYKINKNSDPKWVPILEVPLQGSPSHRTQNRTRRTQIWIQSGHPILWSFFCHPPQKPWFFLGWHHISLGPYNGGVQYFSGWRDISSTVADLGYKSVLCWLDTMFFFWINPHLFKIMDYSWLLCVCKIYICSG